MRLPSFYASLCLETDSFDFDLMTCRDEICRQEFQYAKKTVKKPVIPVVVGSGSFDWMMTVVGLLIAGEVYIHFKNRDVQDSKMAELLTAVRKNIPNISVPAGIGNVSGKLIG